VLLATVRKVFRLRQLALASALTVAFVGSDAPVLAALAAAPEVVGCDRALLRADLFVEVVASDPAAAESEGRGELDDEPGGEGTRDDEDGDPKIVGSISVPRGTPRESQMAMATISGEQAQEIALGALANPELYRVTEVELEVEQGYLVWGVEMAMRQPGSGPRQETEAIIDGGSGEILYVECEIDDD
jgi:uncharacterized membrane protein YkoI